MSEALEAAQAVLVARSDGVWLTAEGREMVLRALEEQQKLISELRANLDKAMCSYCGHVGPKTFEAMNEHMLACQKRPENQLLDAAIAWQERAETAEAQLAIIRAALTGLASSLKESPAGSPTIAPVPPGVPAVEPAGDAVPTSVCLDGCERKGTPHRLCKIVDDEPDAGAAELHEALATTGTEDGRPPVKWGRADGKGAFHLWREGFSESECLEEVADALVLYGDPVPDNACLSCAAIIGWEIPDAAIEKVPAPDKPRRNVPAVCIVPGCFTKGSARKQWVCAEHAKTTGLQERRAALATWKKLRKNGACGCASYESDDPKDQIGTVCRLCGHAREGHNMFSGCEAPKNGEAQEAAHG